MKSQADNQSPLLLVKSGGIKALPEWQSVFNTLLPDLVVKEWHDQTVDPDQVNYVLVWQPDDGQIKQYKHLKAILSTAAGVDHILKDETIPVTIPIIRMVTAETVQRMAEFCSMSALMMLKDMPRIIRQQQDKHWQEVSTPHTAKETTVGIMGLGALGQAAAMMLSQIGFKVRGWSRSLKEIPQVTCFAGKDNLAEFLSETDILICLLPDTPDTQHIVNAATLALLPQGAAVINVARGTHVELNDLFKALEQGHISRALLDVFNIEPLPSDHPVWHHPQIIVTPHSAATPSRVERAKQAATTIAKIEAGLMPDHIYDRQKGY